MRRGEKGQFKESDAVAHSLSQDVRRKAQTVVKPGYGDKNKRNGDHRMAELTTREEQRGWRRIILWGVALGFLLGVLALIATPVSNWVNPNRTGQDKVAGSVESAPPEAIAPAQIATKRLDGQGVYLTDGNGQALYLFEADQRGERERKPTSKCYGNCAKSWPPLTSSGAPEAKTDVDSTLLSLTKREDGSSQVTYNGWPLYRFVRDVGSQKPTGPNLNDFGGTWHLIAPSGEKANVAPLDE